MVRSKNHEAPQFSPAACPFLPFQAQISSPAPNLQTPCSLCSSLNILYQVSRPRKTGNFMVLFILIFMSLDRRENKRFGPSYSTHQVWSDSICSYLHYTYNFHLVLLPNALMLPHFQRIYYVVILFFVLLMRHERIFSFHSIRNGSNLLTCK